jgi:hypothetical protein
MDIAHAAMKTQRSLATLCIGNTRQRACTSLGPGILDPEEERMQMFLHRFARILGPPFPVWIHAIDSV